MKVVERKRQSKKGLLRPVRYSKRVKLRTGKAGVIGFRPSEKEFEFDSVEFASGKVRIRGIGERRSGEVVSCVRVLTSNEKSKAMTPSNLIHAVQAGLSVRELEDLRASLDVSMERLGTMIGISPATLHRRRSGQKLGSAESDRIVRFAKLMGKAVEVMESKENARKWLNSPQFGLGGAIPLEYAETEIGAREVENLLGRIEYGVYS
jgi:putative toxin-antitoxin system antitoxin component (TIGR02293 family)